MSINISIKKASLKEGLFLKGEYDIIMSDANRNVKFDDSHPVHEDLKTIYDSLGEHLRKLCQQPVDFENENTYTCTGFTIGGDGDHEGVVLIGYRDLDGDRTLNLVSPFQKWDGDNYTYADINDLSELIEAAKGEVKAYLIDSKYAPNAQLSLFPKEETTPQEGTVTFIAGGDGATTIPVGDLNEKKRRGRKKKDEKTEKEEDNF